MSTRQNTYTAPVLPFDYPADEEPIWPCHDCLPWHVEVLLDNPDGLIWVREWHAIGCQIWSHRDH